MSEEIIEELEETHSYKEIALWTIPLILIAGIIIAVRKVSIEVKRK